VSRQRADRLPQAWGRNMPSFILQPETHMRALRGVFFFVAATAACFADNSVKAEISKAARVFAAIFSVLFVVAEAMELMS
jgi:hypothetical protein